MHEQEDTFLRKAVNALNNPSAIKQIIHHVKEYYGITLKICYPKDTLDKSKIYFIAERNKFDSFDSEVVKIAIKRILRMDTKEVDEQDFVFLNEQMIKLGEKDALVSDITPLYLSSIKQVLEFLQRNYGQLLEKNSEVNEICRRTTLHV